MIIKISAVAIAAVALSAMLGSTEVRAQETCLGLYNEAMRIYQTDPYSPAYPQIMSYYNTVCPLQVPEPYSYQAPVYTPYGYSPLVINPRYP